MPWYREIIVLQEPRDLGLDDQSRIKYGFNLIAIRRPSATFPAELIRILVAASVGTANTNMFYSSRTTVPKGAGPFLTITETGGMGVERTHNVVATAAYLKSGAQIVVRGDSTAAVRAMAWAAFNALQPIRNSTITAYV